MRFPVVARVSEGKYIIMHTYKYFIFGLIFIFLASCSPQKRFTKLIEKHPYLLTSDTVKITDTIRVNIPSVRVDTIVKINQLTDTIRIEKEHFNVKVWRVRDSVFITGGCDTIRVEKIIERKIPVKYYEKSKPSFWVWILIAGIVILSITIYRKLWEK